ncbi:DUF2218 domain-containing protein [Pseudomonas sp. LRF_L74]|uniref:DUF2218 domain-containing protein n=1 Tax=Pseudomonas sp. LRF_L74 TaxID=3369422 RepID=UPI003F627A9F
MPESHAILITEHAKRCLTRLCRHWAHKFAVSFDEHAGHIDFGGSSCELKRQDDRLEVRIQAPLQELDELEAIVEDHLLRFVPQDATLLFDWQRDSTPETGA